MARGLSSPDAEHLGFGVGFRVSGLGFGVGGLGFRAGVSGFGFQVWG